MKKNDPVYSKQYFQANRENILEKMYQKVRCEVCDIEVMKCNICKHKRSKRHQHNLGHPPHDAETLKDLPRNEDQ